LTEPAKEVTPVQERGRSVDDLSIEELARQQGVKPITSLEDLATGVFESDEEMEEFIAFTYAARRRDLA
jgi:hypothetical protein